MSNIDWIVLLGSFLFIVIYGTWSNRKQTNINEFIKGNNSSKWGTVGLSVMATQASAITFLSIPGQAYIDGMEFIQIYLGLPFAMIVICVTFIPIYHRLKIFTAYEYLEQRFDLKTRIFTAVLFLIQRGVGSGLTIFAPAIILSTILGWNLTTLNILIGSIVILYTVAGGVTALDRTQKSQMAIIFLGMFAAFYVIVSSFPDYVSFGDAIHLAGISGKLKLIDFSLDPSNRYTIWSGILGGFFLSLSYFGTDQSQVGRYLGGASVKESQMGLIFNGLLKVPMQFFILLVGVMVFVFYQFNSSPIFFNTSALSKLHQTAAKDSIVILETKNLELLREKKLLLQKWDAKPTEENSRTEWKDLLKAEKENRDDAKELLQRHLPLEEKNDKDYIFIHFILTQLPRGLIGLLLAVIFAAAMSATASGLTGLANTTNIDIYKRTMAPHKSEQHYVNASRFFIVIWGIFAIGFACLSTLFENLIQFVNIVGSLFYGTILGVFLVGFYTKSIKGTHVFWAAVSAEILVISIYIYSEISYLWLTLVGSSLVLLISLILSVVIKRIPKTY